MNTNHPLVGRRVLNRWRQDCGSSQAYRDAHKGTVTGVYGGCNPLVEVQFDGLEFASSMVVRDLAFCETWPSPESLITYDLINGVSL